ncbi:MAG: hypothetical protein HQM09_09015 [Candidatus Riflebacteria bacterium]|nr:hypothetical protein [Candidatus Riflebacteria bacterium]
MIQFISGISFADAGHVELNAGKALVCSEMSPNAQRQDTVQTILQTWFLDRICTFQKILSDTPIGNANPKIVNIAIPEKLLRMYLAKPFGEGKYRIIFDSAETARMPEWGYRRIEFPKNQSLEYIRGISRLNTCWHEFQHIIFFEAEKKGLKLSVRPVDWVRYCKPPLDAVAEHVYIESLTERTVEWLDILLHEKTKLFNGAGMAFTKHILEAADEKKKMPVSGMAENYLTEHYIWAKAHDSWVRAWRFAKMIAPLPGFMRKEYAAITGVSIGSIDEIMYFFAQGGMSDKAGNQILVPRWVMQTGVSRSPLFIGPFNERRVVNALGTSIEFDFRILEDLHFGEKNGIFLDRGKVNISLEHPAPECFIKLVLEGTSFHFESDKVPGNAVIQASLKNCPKDCVAHLVLNFSKYSVPDGASNALKIEFRDDPVIRRAHEICSYDVNYFDETRRAASEKTKFNVPLHASSPIRKQYRYYSIRATCPIKNH